jgi:hypothetical protein
MVESSDVNIPTQIKFLFYLEGHVHPSPDNTAATQSLKPAE